MITLTYSLTTPHKKSNHLVLTDSMYVYTRNSTVQCSPSTTALNTARHSIQ